MSMLLVNWEILDVIGSKWGLNDTSKAGKFRNQPMWVSTVLCGVVLELVWSDCFAVFFLK